MRPFGCHVTILNTLDYLGKFDGKSDKGFFIGYSMNSKAFRVYNIRTRKVEENLHIMFLKDKPIITGDGPKWLFDIDVLTKSMNYVEVIAGTNSNDLVGTEESIDAGHSRKETGSSQDYILMPLWKDVSLFDSSSKNVFGKTHARGPSYLSVVLGFLSLGRPKKKVSKGLDLDGFHMAKEHWTLLERPDRCVKSMHFYRKRLRGSFMSVQTLGFEDPEIDKTLFIKRVKTDILLVQVYVDDIIFGSTKKILCTEFEKLMHKKFQMSSMGELTFFLGLQVIQKDDGIFISQDKYEIFL
ncbi:uncharacterized mitochondrial protein-like protein [Tanacetum coccineum]